MKVENIIKENKRRIKELNQPYNPFTGIGSPIEREKLVIDELGEFYLPLSFFDTDFGCLLEHYGSIQKFAEQEPYVGNINTVTKLYLETRSDHDFEFYAAYALKIEDKDTALMNPFILRRAQRRLLWELEEMRLAGVPIRIVLLKARQWGGSTLVQMYMFWIQQRLKINWHITVCAQDDSAAKNVRKMYEKAAESYPKELGDITLQSYARSAKNLQCKETGGILGVGSINNTEQFRSYSNKMIHMTELGSWRDTPQRTGKKLASSLKNAIANVPYSVIVEESTAQGVGNYFHDEWLAAEKGKFGSGKGKSRYKPIFVPWFEIELYESKERIDYSQFIPTMTEYEQFLWSLGATLENIHWYRTYKEGENKSELEMFEEYPSTATEAFVSSGSRVYPHKYVLNARETVEEPVRVCNIEAEAMKGEKALKNIKLVDDKINGKLNIWSPPQTEVLIDGRKYRVTNRYALFGDFGGTSKTADFSALCVIDRFWMIEGGMPEVAAIWHGHLDAFLFAWATAQIATIYDNGLLALESNTPDKDKNKEGNHFLTAINQLAGIYHNMYIRNNHESIKQDFMPKYGFHTNTSTKTMIIDRHKEACRSKEYVERFSKTCDEMDYYEHTQEGKMEAQSGKHDDLVIVTAGATWLALEFMPPPKLVPILTEQEARAKYGNTQNISEITF